MRHSGVGRAMYAKASYPDKKGGYYPGNKPGDHYIIWMPKLYSNSSEWKNSIHNNGKEIHEDAELTRREDWIPEGILDVSLLRIVFVKSDSKSPYKFMELSIVLGKWIIYIILMCGLPQKSN